MGSIWLKEFTAGLDNRRMFEAASGGVLVRANNGHITRGGEFEQRAAFVPEFTLPAGTIGMFSTPASIVVFGHTASPTMPTGIAYQRLQHSDETTALVRVLSTDLYAGKIYAVGEFADGAVFHFYDGARVTDWFDGRARATFAVTGGVSNAAIPATGSFEITAGTADPANEITGVLVDSVDILGAAVTHTGDNSTTATAVAAAITSYTSSPDYTAVAVGATVTITAAVAGTAANGLVVAPGVAGDATVGSIVNMAGGSASATSRVDDIKVNGVSILTGPVEWTASNVVTATAIAAAINSLTSAPDYTASAVGPSVSIAAADAGPGPNGFVVSFTLANAFAVSPTTLELAEGDTFGGAIATGAFTVATGTPGDTVMVALGGVDLMAAPVAWDTDATTTAAAIAAAINSHTSTPNFAATSSTGRVTVSTATRTDAVNNEAFAFTYVGTFTTSDPTTMIGGADDDAFTPGEFVKTISQKVYSTSGPNTHFSGVAEPTKWTTDATGAGFIDMSSESSGSEELTALARYQNFVAVFAATVVQIWFMDPDPALNRLVQILNNTGTASPRSVTAFGNSDLLYLDESGLRSMKARDSSNAAATTDIGVPVDTLITEQLATLDDNERRQVVGLIEPRFGRFWLIMRGKIFVFSYFNGAKVSAWSTYDASYIDEDDQTVAFDVDDALVYRRRVYLRAGDTIYVYGGIAAGDTHDATEAEAWLPYLDADDPTRMKQLNGLDLALRGLWSVAAAFEPADEAAEDHVGIYDQTTYNSAKNPFNHQATHVSLRFRSQGVGPHRLGAAVIHYEGSDDDD